ncbi:MAG: DUF1641 domain-containing protein [Conexivisphaerales archaeon]
MEKTESIEKVMQKLSKPENLEALSQMVDLLPVMKKSALLVQQLDQMGALDTLFSLACAIANSKGMLSDEMVAGAASLASNGIELLSKLGSPEMQKIISAVLDHSVELEESMSKAERVKGVLGLMKQLRDPDVQKGMAALFAFLKVFGRYVQS